MNHELLTGRMTVNEVIQRFPRTVAVFQRYGIDACCGGALPIEEAAARHKVPLQMLLDQLGAHESALPHIQ